VPSFDASRQQTQSSNAHPAHSESSEAIVSRIYEEELMKLAEQAKQAGNMTEYQLYQVHTTS